MGTFSLQCHCGLEFEYLKLVELVIIMVLGNVEDERTFSIINFMNSKLCNHLIVHLDLVVNEFACLEILQVHDFHVLHNNLGWGKEKLCCGDH
jgi:hypothetical protein